MTSTDSLDFIDHSDSKAVSSLFVGRKIVSTNLFEKTLTLDNGVKLRIHPNENAWGDEGNFFLDEICDFEHVITSAKVEEKVFDVEKGKIEEISLFVYAAGVRVGNAAKKKVKGKVAVISGDAGDGCYGTGFKIEVVEAE